MASIVHQLSSSDEDSEDSLPDLARGVEASRPPEGLAKRMEEPEAVDLTLSSPMRDTAPEEDDWDDCILEDTGMLEDPQETDERENHILEATDIHEGIEEVNDLENQIFDATDMDEGLREAEGNENCILEATDMDEGIQDDAHDMENCILDATDMDEGLQKVNEMVEGGYEEVDMGIGTQDMMEAVRERPEEGFTPPRHKAPRLSTEELQDDEICFLDEVPSFQESRPGQTKATGRGPKKPGKASTKEEREAAKQQREEEKRQRAAEKEHRMALRQQRATEKEAEKARRTAERNARKAMKPGECLKLLVVELDRRLVEAGEGGRVLSQLQEAGVACRVVESRVAASITFFRVDPLSGEESQAEEVVVVVQVESFVAAVRRQVYGGGDKGSLCHLCGQWKAALGTPNLALVVCGLDDYLRKQMFEKQRQIRSTVLGEEPRRRGPSSASSSKVINRVDVETALVAAQMECHVNHRLLPDGGKVALYIQQVAKAVAELPYKREKGDALFSWYAEGSSVNSVKVDRSGVGLFKLWQQQLRQFNHVGVEVAQAVTSKYPSPMALVQAYHRCGSQREAEQLLADLRVRRSVGPLVSEQRVGKEFSRKLHLFLTSTNPDQPLAANS
ncbi:crossover junction endonuclease EME1-like [Eriocheir sinensis]|uniref:crossover junction endonuclease EME1-like n=1 Tax=Eriocheir sinensis TaxID=95602 RepID=UPI0021CA9267|nr:crossover junction endonuclease EME1-like [Eriocheir sinensis]